ncbi:MAG: hypothetical protein Q7T63_17575 [Burkholderiaceae bacterium]|nr:hypothetical protein [Burkholderiaceae bacterium]MDO9089915.1 hypothetical protein [Burkholderiaceae bacterium]
MDPHGKLRLSPAGLQNIRDFAFDQRNLEEPPARRPHSAPERAPAGGDSFQPEESFHLEPDFYKYYMRDRRDYFLDGRSDDSNLPPRVGTAIAQMRKDTSGSNLTPENVHKCQAELPPIQNLPVMPLPTLIWSGGRLLATDVIQRSPEFAAISIPVTRPKKKNPDL